MLVLGLGLELEKMCMNFMKYFMRNSHFFLCIDKTMFVICQSIVRSENSLPFLWRSFTLKDNHLVLKVYKFLVLGLG